MLSIAKSSRGDFIAHIYSNDCSLLHQWSDALGGYKQVSECGRGSKWKFFLVFVNLTEAHVKELRGYDFTKYPSSKVQPLAYSNS